jgi:hypothetical protein
MPEGSESVAITNDALREAFPGMGADRVARLGANVHAQLEALVEQRLSDVLDDHAAITEALPGLSVAEIVALAKAGIASGVDVGNADPYTTLAETFPGKSPDEAVAEIRAKAKMLADYYAKLAA